jgi:hypothetical protein
MVTHLAPQDWVAVFMAFVALVGVVGQAFALSRRLGRHEAEFDRVKTDVAKLTAQDADRQVRIGEFEAMRAQVADHEVQLQRMPVLDTALQVLAESIRMLRDSFSQFRIETREARAETNTNIATMGQEIKGELREMRRSVNSPPARRRDS